MVESFRPILLVSDLGLSQQYIPMQTQAPKRVLAVMTDLFFSVKLVEAAKRCGLSLEFVKEPKELLEKAATLPSLIVRRVAGSIRSTSRSMYSSMEGGGSRG